MPIKDSSGDVIGVAQVINKLNYEKFSENDEKVLMHHFRHANRYQMAFQFNNLPNLFFHIRRYSPRIFNFVVLA